MPERTTQNAQTLLSPRVPRDTEHERYHPELEEELKECLFCLKRNEMMFDLEVDTDLIEQRIYERQALLCRYRYLLARARELGLQDTHFTNPNGLDAPEHYSSAADLAVLGAYAMENPIFAKTVSTKTVQAAGRYLRNHNKLLWVLPGAEGIKTGFTRSAGRILVSSSQRQGRRLVAATMDAPDDWRDHQSLLEAGFQNYQVEQLLAAGEQLGARVVAGGEGKARILAAEDFSYALAQGERPQIVLGGQDFAYAPVTEGADAGTAYVLLSGKIIGRVPTVYGETVEQIVSEKKPFWQRLLER